MVKEKRPASDKVLQALVAMWPRRAPRPKKAPQAPVPKITFRQDVGK